jgi:hypothetical protein
MPSGEVTVFWTWVNKIGNREYYMECADISINTNNNISGDLSGKELLVVNLPGYPIIPEFAAFDAYNGTDLFEKRKDITIKPASSSSPLPSPVPTLVPSLELPLPPPLESPSPSPIQSPPPVPSLESPSPIQLPPPVPSLELPSPIQLPPPVPSLELPSPIQLPPPVPSLELTSPSSTPSLELPSSSSLSPVPVVSTRPKLQMLLSETTITKECN